MRERESSTGDSTETHLSNIPPIVFTVTKGRRDAKSTSKVAGSFDSFAMLRHLIFELKSATAECMSGTPSFGRIGEERIFLAKYILSVWEMLLIMDLPGKQILDPCGLCSQRNQRTF